mgnify:FL=1
MKREMDLVRELLLRIESLQLAAGSTVVLHATKEPLAHEGDDPAIIAYHMGLLMSAGLVDPAEIQYGADTFIIRGLTWSGHDLLDSIRDPAIWRETKEGITKAGGFSFDLLKDLAKGLIKTQIEKHTGVKL